MADLLERPHRPARRLRALLNGDEMVLAPGCGGHYSQDMEVARAGLSALA